jgi:hypothetical protein
MVLPEKVIGDEITGGESVRSRTDVIAAGI